MVIEDGSALEPWRGGKDERKRRAALNQARRQIESPQRAPTRIKRFLPCTCDWEPTELVAYRRRTGDYGPFCGYGQWRTGRRLTIGGGHMRDCAAGSIAWGQRQRGPHDARIAGSDCHDIQQEPT